jgi:hypothetical protein
MRQDLLHNSPLQEIRHAVSPCRNALSRSVYCLMSSLPPELIALWAVIINQCVMRQLAKEVAIHVSGFDAPPQPMLR